MLVCLHMVVLSFAGLGSARVKLEECGIGQQDVAASKLCARSQDVCVKLSIELDICQQDVNCQQDWTTGSARCL